jgi:hypothetical protein
MKFMPATQNIPFFKTELAYRKPSLTVKLPNPPPYRVPGVQSAVSPVYP